LPLAPPPTRPAPSAAMSAAATPAAAAAAAPAASQLAAPAGTPSVPPSMASGVSPQSVMEQAQAAGVPFSAEEIAGKDAGALTGLLLHKMLQRNTEVMRQKAYADKVIADEQARHEAEMKPKYDALVQAAKAAGVDDEAALKMAQAAYHMRDGAPMAKLLDTFVQNSTKAATGVEAEKKRATELEAKAAELEKKLQGYQEREALSAANARKRGGAGQFVPDRMATGGAAAGAGVTPAAAGDAVADVAVNAGYGQRDTSSLAAGKRWRAEDVSTNTALDRDAVARVCSILTRIDRGAVETDFSNVTFGRAFVDEWLSGDGTAREVAVNASANDKKQGGVHTGGCTDFDLRCMQRIIARGKGSRAGEDDDM